MRELHEWSSSIVIWTLLAVSALLLIAVVLGYALGRRSRVVNSTRYFVVLPPHSSSEDFLEALEDTEDALNVGTITEVQ
jgi:hypothetical protein